MRFSQKFRTREWPGSRLPEIYYDPRSLELDAEKRASLHAKCVVIDNKLAFVSSANFTGAAQERNIEIGVLIRSKSFAQRLALKQARLDHARETSRVFENAELFSPF
jgi:phosphatidylserine/phosphatidylglycerophosphate/cardiolipin synthase-like enzyme